MRVSVKLKTRLDCGKQRNFGQRACARARRNFAQAELSFRTSHKVPTALIRIAVQKLVKNSELDVERAPHNKNYHRDRLARSQEP